MKKVAVGLSGGVDSGVCAMLLKRQGYEVVGVHIYCWPPKREIEKDGMTRQEWMKKNGCRADEDRASALKTAIELGIQFKVLDFSDEYNDRVISYFYDEYKNGRTPNPDVMCNSEIKFGLFLQWAMENGYDYIATGHYAESMDVNDRMKLLIPVDKHKDQTYFLWKLGQEELCKVIFPLGKYTKDRVRLMAAEEGLSVANKPDSQGICFVGSVEAREFLERRLKPKRGVVRNSEGEAIGEHDGVWFYTVGQRGGWKMTGEAQRKYTHEEKMPALYVVSKDAERNELVVGLAVQATSDHFEVTDLNWIDQTPDFEEEETNILVRIRHGGELMGAKIQGKEKLRVELIVGVRGVASGQSAVFYSESGEVLGGGVIS